ncbi:type VII secretion protein EccB [Saccharothrix ecbatanensis]|uniref:Type VII secretion protein EccB n=1 Tax=Saccharothrix ecbatanensis TaxID=1105145 RepID=A0A7W9HPT2_9PSEU|nr:type VII secretion protein EccB [Saccharothrix ecbatanensis]MBB5806179.1 type VII secretion protein EccB [Saccharothrix ecbatanensis]
MASTPTTKSQVQAYRFVLRRMQSALVRRDAVMLHDPMRTHSRATAVGVLLGIVGMIGFLIFGFFSPNPQLGGDTKIAISKETGQVYVVSELGGTKTLIPMTNLASARLLLLQQQTADQGSVGGGDAAAGAVNQAAPEAAGGAPKLVSEKALSKLPKGRLTGIPDGPDVLPKPADRIGSDWSVCDTLHLDEALNDPAAPGKFTTTVLAGISGGGDPLDGNRALLVRVGTDDKQAYLIYKAPVNSKITSTSTVRAKVDLGDEKVRNALNLANKPPRAISSGLLNAIPEAKPLVAPEIAGRGQKVTYITRTTDLKVGGVIEVRRAGAGSEFHVLLKDGIQRVSRAAADLLRAAYAQGDPKLVDIADINNAPTTEQLDFSDYPPDVPEVLDANQNNRVVCLGWQAKDVTSDNKSQHTKVTIAPSLPIPAGTRPVSINQVGATGEVVSEFVMMPGKAAVVRSATSTQDFGSGPIHLITGRGVKYGIPDKTTSGALGLGGDGFAPGPESILRLLPNGPQLNRNEAARSWDSIPAPKGNSLLPEEQAKKQGS